MSQRKGAGQTGAAEVPDFDAAARLFSAAGEDDEFDTVAKAADEADLPQIAGYTIEYRLGSGGSGDVYRAVGRGSQRLVAIKLLRAPLGSGDKARRAWRELDLLAQLRLTCIPQMLDYGQHEGRLYIVTDFIDGSLLADYCHDEELDRAGRVQLLAKVADAVQALHEHGVIHRDIKPENVIVNCHGQPVIVDLGIATLLTENLTETLTVEGTPFGSPAYMSPEQARGERALISTRSDVYGLGATAYYILIGQMPYDTDTSVFEAVHRVAREDPRHPRELDRGIPRQLAAVLHKAVSPRPKDRYESASELARDLRRWLNRDPVEATGLTVARRIGRLATRYPIPTTTAACLAVAGMVFALTFLSVWWLNSMPYRMEIVGGDNSIARLLARSDRPLMEWDTGCEDGIVFAELIQGGMLGREEVALIGIQHQRDGEDLPGPLCAFETRNEYSLLWSSDDEQRRLRMPPPISDVEEGLFRIRWVQTIDIFPDAQSPGPEIVALHRYQPYSPTAIRIYDVRGEVLWQVWHDGHLNNAYWLTESKQLVLCGVNSECTWADRGHPEVKYRPYPFVVFAVRPEFGRIHQEWIHTAGGKGTYEPEWYRCLLPPGIGSAFGDLNPTVVVTSPRIEYGAGYAVRFDLRSKRPPHAEITLVLDAHGAQIDRHVPTVYEVQEGLPDPETVSIGALPAMLQVESPRGDSD